MSILCFPEYNHTYDNNPDVSDNYKLDGQDWISKYSKLILHAALKMAFIKIVLIELILFCIGIKFIFILSVK